MTHFIRRGARRTARSYLAGHSQGSLHLTNLLKDRVAGTPLASRIVAAYIVGWPVSVEADVPALGLDICKEPEQVNCLLSWESFAEPADYGRIVEVYDTTIGFTGDPRAGTQLLCTNPLRGDVDSAAPASENLGTLVPNDKLSDATLVEAAVPARCDDRGFLLIGDPPDLGPYTLPGNNYHVYDYSLFWRNVRADVVRRMQSFSGTLITNDLAEFRASLPDGGRLMALDVGSKRSALPVATANGPSPRQRKPLLVANFRKIWKG